MSRPSSWLSQTATLMGQTVRAELASPERLVSSLLFSATVLLLFKFAVGEVEPELIPKIFVMETYLTAFFALQLAFARTFEPDTADRVFDLLRTYPIRPSAWFVSRYLTVLAMGALILLPTIALAALFQTTTTHTLISIEVIVVSLAALAGLAAMGVLLATMTMRSGARQILYPLLYFPLTTPVLLAASESSQALIAGEASMQVLLSSWLGLLIIFDIIYVTFGMLIFGELVKPE